jgi:hypothetical protein
MKTLTLEHLSAYLPYGLKCSYLGITNGSEISRDRKQFVEENEPYPNFAYYEPIQEVIGVKIAPLKTIRVYKKYWIAMCGVYSQGQKNFINGMGISPILYPLSSLTETIWFEGKEINPSEFIKDWYNEKYATEIDDLEYYALENEFALFGAVHETLHSQAEIIAMPYQAYQLLFKIKIDIFGLIEKGLALDVNSLETNPYK